MNISELERAQADMRRAFVGGATGIFASAGVWMAAGVVSLVATPRTAMFSLCFGGMFIHPLAIGYSRLLGSSGMPAKGNPLARLALEGTVWMLLTIPLAFALSFQRVEWFYVAMLLIIGGRYLTFATLYGMRIYWACGGVLASAALALFALGAGDTFAAFTGGAIELIFAAVIYRWCRVREVGVSQTTP
ncbi:MAG: hypothetical protein ABI821_11255 [Pseudomonadota bacterium]